MKAYISRCEGKEDRTIEYRFEPDLENAACWDTGEEAEKNRAIFDRQCIVIPSAEGGTHICSSFKVEQRGPKEFAVFCVAPFIVLNRGRASNPQMDV